MTDSKLETAKSIIEKEGFLSLIKKGFRYYRGRFYKLGFYSPICFFKINRMKSEKNLNFLMDFTFNGCSKALTPMQNTSELGSLLKILKIIKPKTVLEIGTARGGSLFLFARVASCDASIISIDLPGGRFGGGYPRWRIPLYKSFILSSQKLHLIRQDSHDMNTVKTVQNILNGEKVDFLFIDGDHTYEGVKKDFELYHSLVKKGGYVAFDDIATQPPKNSCKVSKFWKQIKKKYKYEEFIMNKSQKWNGIGLIKV